MAHKQIQKRTFWICAEHYIFFTAGLSVVFIDATIDKPAKLQIRRIPEAKVFLVKISGQDIQDDYLIGTKTSMEFHYHTLVMKTSSKKPEEIKVQVEVSALNGEGYKLSETSVKELSKWVCLFACF